jgi:hypothetical protein
MQNTNNSPELPARIHAEAAVLFRRPFAPGAIGFRAMTKVPYNGPRISSVQHPGPTGDWITPGAGVSAPWLQWR